MPLWTHTCSLLLQILWEEPARWSYVTPSTCIQICKEYRFDTYLKGFWVIWGCFEGFHEITCLILICCRYQPSHCNLLALQLSSAPCAAWFWQSSLLLSLCGCEKIILLFRMVIVTEGKPIILWQTDWGSAELVQHSGKRGWVFSTPGASVEVTYGEMRWNSTF